MVSSLKLRAILFPFQMEPRRELLLHELGEMWDEIGEAEEDRRETLHALEEECLNVYRVKVAQVRQHRAHLQREIADSVAEVAAICATIGEPPATVHTACSSLQSTGNLKEELGSIPPELEEMRRRREDRRRQFLEVTELINRMQQEMNPGGQPRVSIDDSDLTMRKLQELRAHLQHLRLEKENRIRKMAELVASLHSSSLVLGMDTREVNRRGDEQGDISDGAIARLVSKIERLREIKRNRMQKQSHQNTCAMVRGIPWRRSRAYTRYIQSIEHLQNHHHRSVHSRCPIQVLRNHSEHHKIHHLYSKHISRLYLQARRKEGIVFILLPLGEMLFK